MIRFDFFSLSTRRFYLYLIMLLCLQKHAWGADKLQQAKIDSLRSVIANCAQDTTCAKTLLALSDCYRSINTDSALFWVQRLISFSQKKKLGKHIGIGFMAKGNIYRFDSKLGKSKTAYLLALKEFQKINDYDGMIEAFNGISFYHFQSGSIQDSIQLYFDKILSLKNFVQHKNLIGDAYCTYSTWYINKAGYHLAMDHLMSAVKIYDEIHDEQSKLYAINSIAVVYGYMKNIDKAIELYKGMEDKALQLRLYPLYSTVLLNLGSFYADKKEYNKTQDYYRRTLLVNEKYNIREDNDVIYTKFAKIKWILHQSDSAIYFATKALSIASAANDYQVKRMKN